MSGRTGFYFAKRLIDRYRNREKLTQHQIEFALAAIEQVHSRRAIHGLATFEFEDEQRLREKVAAR
ncbi:hypothetical protein P3T18_005391 [Paraburkholderia sp. GAS199]|uniref:hypothetical protein n=1 Tax=Paraburkholderia sp. GAS199 TaxID=3035126 RepID=UPI003D207372